MGPARQSRPPGHAATDGADQLTRRCASTRRPANRAPRPASWRRISSARSSVRSTGCGRRAQWSSTWSRSSSTPSGGSSPGREVSGEHRHPSHALSVRGQVRRRDEIMAAPKKCSPARVFTRRRSPISPSRPASRTGRPVGAPAAQYRRRRDRGPRGCAPGVVRRRTRHLPR